MLPRLRSSGTRTTLRLFLWYYFWQFWYQMSENLNIQFEKIQSSIKESAFNVKKQYDQSNVGRFQKEWTLWARFWSHIARMAYWLWSWIIYPVTSRVFRATRWFARQYRDLWLSVVYYKDEYGVQRFSKLRGFATIFATTIIAAIVIVHLWAGLVFTFWYLPLVQHDETLYLYNSQKISEGIDPYSTWDDIHEVHGCETLPCNDQTSVTFRVKATWFNELWSVYHNGSLFYPGYVAGAVAPIMNKCTITSYGIRKKFRTLMRSWDIYPDLIKVTSCAPVVESAPVLQNKDYR